MTVYNAACDAGFYNNETLGSLRQSLMERLGYAAQTDNPPPGMVNLLNNFLKRGQAFLLRRYRALQTERIYHWQMAEGERFYGILDSINNDDPTCDKTLNIERVTGAWVEDLNATWLPLVKGINPNYYTSVTYNGLPAFYEIRQTIEVFPAPQAAYTLHIKGHFGALQFVEDDDICTVDPELLFLWALANAKNHYGQQDAADVAAEAKTLLGEIVAASHQTARYIPGGAELPPPLPKPVFLG